MKDHHDRLLATKREGTGTGWGASTRYVYDELDRLAAVIGAGIAVSDTLSMWRYGYDDLGRLRSKGVPGSVREYYTYDSEDRIITITRGNEYTEITYDTFGHVTAKYITIGSGSRTQIESHQYDSYSSTASTLIGGSSYTSGPKKGLETWASYAVTDGQGGFSGTASTAYAYDALGRLTRSVTQYADGHKNTTVISYDFAGNPTSTVVTGVRPGGGTTDVLSVTTTYDARERPSSTVSVLTIGGNEKARNTTTYSYDALGRQSAVSSGPTSSAGLLASQYAYTLQQWTSSITTSLGGRTVFSETLGYDSPSNSLGGPSYTGLITRKNETWTIPTGPLTSQFQAVPRTEDYVYDYAARLSAWDDSSSGENISYDARGNITSRSPRYGSGGTVTLTYSGDRLATRKVGTGTAVSFAHDSFARMTTDAEAGLTIAYNVLDLPERISQGTTLKVKYTYLADGTKVSALDASGAGLVYRGPFTYRKGSGGTLTFESAPFDSGRLTEAGTRYHVTDHLGSVRAVINGNASTTTYPLTGFYSVDDFAPFGTKSTSSASTYLSLASTGSTVSLRDGFTGQEDQLPDFSIGYSDFGARHYSPTLSRWLVPDPMGEKYYDVSPYVYCAGNPVSLVDKKGTDIYIVIWTTGYNRGVGHAGIAISNYKKETYVEINNGIKITQTRMIPDGTYSFFDNWPAGEGVNLNIKGALKSVPAYRNYTTISSNDEFMNGSTVSPSEDIGPNAVVRISTSYEQDKAVSERLLDANKDKTLYNGAWYNCSTYVSDGLKALFGKRIGKENMLGPIKATTPNQLWKDILTTANEEGLPYEVLQDPGTNVEIRFKSYIK